MRLVPVGSGRRPGERRLEPRREVEKRAQLQRQRPAARIDKIDRPRHPSLSELSL